MDAPVIGAPAPAVPRISLPPWTVIGHRADGRPIHNIAGGAPDDDDTDVDLDDAEPEVEPDDEPDPEADEDEGEPAAVAPKPGPKKVATAKPAAAEVDADDWKPPSHDEWDRVKRTMAVRKTEKLEALKLVNELRAKSAEAETDTEKAVREATEQGERKYKRPLVRSAAKSALIQAGAIAGISDKAQGDARIARLLKLVDIDDLSIDDEGEVLGLDEQITEMQAAYPELFARPEAPAPKLKPRPTAAPKPAAAEKPKASWERHAESALRTS